MVSGQARGFSSRSLDTGERSVEVNTFIEGVNFNQGSGGGGESALSTLTGCVEMTDSTSIAGDILLVFVLEFLNKVIDKSVVEVPTKVDITCNSLDIEDVILNYQEGNTKGSSTKIKDKNITFASDLLAKTIGDCSSSRLINDLENVESRDGPESH